MKLPATQALYAYWNKQRRGRCAPNRHELDPAEIRGLLPHTFMLAADDQAGAFPIRLSGTRVDALFGRDLKGRPFAELWTEPAAVELRDLLAGVLDGAQPALAGVRGAPAGYPPSSFELLVLPLRHNGRTHARLLCGLLPAAMPVWLGLRSAERLHVSSWRFVDGNADPAPERTRTGGLRRGHLVVHQGGLDGQRSSAMSQSRVKALVPNSGHTLLSTRRS